MNNSDRPPRRRRRSLPIFLTIVAVFTIVVAIASKLTGVPVFEQFRERAKRIAERHLPVEDTATAARRKLSLRLREAGLILGSPIFIRIFKEEAELEVWVKSGETYSKLHSYPICKHSGFLGPKLKEGDKQAPEGFYAVTRKQLNPGSRHYRAFNIGFPNEYDRAHGRTGTYLMVHGGCTSIGCYAMTDAGIAEIYRLVEQALLTGQKRVPVHIFPFRMSRSKLSKYPTGRWTPYWENLKQGYDLFEQSGLPPVVGTCNKRYVFNGEAQNCTPILGW